MYNFDDDDNDSVYYIRGGVEGATSKEEATTACANAGERLEEYSYWKTLPTNISTSQSKVRSVQNGRYYWSLGDSLKYYCFTAPSCVTSTTVANSGGAGTSYKPHYYCYGKMQLGE